MCLIDGHAAAVLEKSGEILRIFDRDHASQALSALAREFRSGRIFTGRDRLCIKTYPDCTATPLKTAGFARIMLDFVLYR